MRARYAALLALAVPASPYAVRPSMAPARHLHAACRRAPPPAAKAPVFLFERYDENSLRFGCSQQTITMVKPEPAGSLEDFLSSSADAVVVSSWPAGKVRHLGSSDGVSEFEIDVEEFDFVALKFRVELRVRCWLEGTTAHLESLGFNMIGPGVPPGLADAINVRVRGSLKPSAAKARVCALSGNVEFVAEGELPPLLQRAPEPALRAAARAMSESLIAAAAERFGSKVPGAYAAWAAKGAR